jgi:hypothetical protein
VVVAPGHRALSQPQAATVTITNPGSGYTSNPTFVPNSGTIGTSTTAFSACENTSNATTMTAFSTSYTVAAGLLNVPNRTLRVTQLWQQITSASTPAVSPQWMIEGVAGVTIPSINPSSSLNFGYTSNWTIGDLSSTRITSQLTGFLPAGWTNSQIKNSVTQPITVADVGTDSVGLITQLDWSAASAGNALQLLGMIVEQLN